MCTVKVHGILYVAWCTWQRTQDGGLHEVRDTVQKYNSIVKFTFRSLQQQSRNYSFLLELPFAQI